MTRTILYVSTFAASRESGAGRVTWHWKEAFQRRGDRFIELDPARIGPVPHPLFLPRAAWRASRGMREKADVLLVHEPLGGAMARAAAPLVVFSHGLERRRCEVDRAWRFDEPGNNRFGLRRLLRSWRLRGCDAGLRRAADVLLINSQDANFAVARHGRDAGRCRVFRNGIHPTALDPENVPAGTIRVLFMGTWILRKGIATLAAAADILRRAGVTVAWILAGTGAPRETIARLWPRELMPSTEIVPRFQWKEEEAILARSHLFVLPSFFEGQPLALLQAMAAGRCCITSDCCGQRDLIRNGENGLLHEPGDAAGLAELIRQCAESGQLRRNLGHAARTSVLHRSWETVSDEVAGIVHQVADRFAQDPP